MFEEGVLDTGRTQCIPRTCYANDVQQVGLDIWTFWEACFAVFS